MAFMVLYVPKLETGPGPYLLWNRGMHSRDGALLSVEPLLWRLCCLFFPKSTSIVYDSCKKDPNVGSRQCANLNNAELFRNCHPRVDSHS